jgi:hypothetical protein
MAKGKKLTDEEIGRLASAEISAAVTYDGTDFQKDRVRAMKYYRGEMDDLESEEGLSTAVTHDVQDVIGWILPGLMRVFFSADELGQYLPENEDDEQGAKQATDYAHYVIMKECSGYQVFWDVFHDALLHANGMVKHWWEESEKVTVHFASGLDDDQYAELVNSKEIEIIAHREDEIPVELPEPEPPIELPMPPGGPPTPGGAPPGMPSMPGGPQPQPPLPQPQAAAAMNGQVAPALPPGLLGLMNGAQPMPGPSLLPPMPLTQTIHSVKVRRTQKYGCLKVAALPPEEFLINIQARDVATARMTGHRMLKTRSELIEAGYDEDLVNRLPATSGLPSFGNLPQVRRDHAATYPAYPGLDKSMEEVEVTEVYMKMDADGDGVAEMMKVVMGDTLSNIVLDAELWEDESPFSDFVAERVPHRWQGRSVFNDTEDIQRIKSTLLRQYLDNLYHANIPDRAVNIDRIANPDALTDRKIGNNIHVEGDPAGAIMDLQVPFAAKEALGGLEYMDQVIERRTGVSRATMALDLEALQNQSATAVNAAQSAAYSKIELIARNFAEMGFERFFKCVLKLIVAHQDAPRRIKIKKNWVTMDPASWNANMKFNVNVGLGSGSRDRDAAILMQIAGKQEQINMQLGPDNPICGIDKYANTLRKLVTMALPSGEPDQFFNEIEPAAVTQWMQSRGQQQDPKAQAEQQKAQAQIQKGQQEIQLKQQAAQADAQLKQQSVQLDMATKAQKGQADLQATREKNAMAMQAEREKNAFALEADREKAAQEAAQREQEARLDAQLRQDEMYLEADLTREANRMQAHVADQDSRRKADVNIQRQKTQNKGT